MADEQKIVSMMDIGCCDREEAIEWLSKAENDVVEAVSLKMGVPPPKVKQLDETQEFFTKTRHLMDKLVDGIQRGFISSNQSESLEHSDSQIHHEGMAQQSNCSQECRPPSPVSEVEIPEIAYQSQSEYSCDLQSNGQK